MRAGFVAIMLLVLAAGCASPREKTFKTALKDYKRANQATVEFARAQVKQLVTVTRTFRSAFDRWPQTFDELLSFASSNKLALDPFAFNDVTFAVLADGTVQIHYDVNCARFNTPQYKFTQTGSVNEKKL